MNRNELLKIITPDDTTKKIAQDFLSQLPQNKDVTFELGGSLAKNTHLRTNSDIDIFARFTTDGLISERLHIILRKYKPIKVHGSRDYFQIKKKNVTIEIVPVLKINDYQDAKNVTDMSPLHVKWASKHLTKKLREDIRITKQFCKAGKIYGAESHIQGFSGHVIDILVIYYGGFINLLKAASNWKEKEIIDIEQHNSVNRLSSSKIQGPLIVIDPVQPDRNAAAGLAKTSCQKFCNLAKQFLRTKDYDMFIEKKLSLSKVINSECVIEICFKPKKGKADVVGSKIKQAVRYLEVGLEEFGVIKSEFDFKRAFITLRLKKLPSTKAIAGPPITKKYHVNIFKKKYSITFEEQGRIHTSIKREYTDPLKLVKKFITDDYVVKRIGVASCKKY